MLVSFSRTYSLPPAEIPKGCLASSLGSRDGGILVAGFPLPLDHETDWNKMFSVSGCDMGQGESGILSPIFLLKSCSCVPSFTQVPEKQESEGLFSLPFLFIVATAFSFTHPQQSSLREKYFVGYFFSPPTLTQIKKEA